MLEKHIFPTNIEEFIVLISHDETDLFKYFNVSQIQNFNLFDAEKSVKKHEIYIKTLCGYSPVNGRPYIFLNQKMMNELPVWKTASKITSCTNTLSFLLHNDSKESELYANAIMERLNFPKIYFMYVINEQKHKLQPQYYSRDGQKTDEPFDWKL